MGTMKSYTSFIREAKSLSAVYVFGRFNPPTAGHLLLIQKAKQVAKQKGAELVVYVSRTQDAKKNPLTLAQKLHYLNLAVPGVKFEGATDTVRTPIEAAKELNKKYNKLILVAGSDRVESFDTVLKQYNGKEYNYDSIEVVSAGERDPDADDASGISATKLRDAASSGDFNAFKDGSITGLREIDAKRMFNDVRIGMKLEPIKESLERSPIREKLFARELFKPTQIVESNGCYYYIADIGANHLLVVDSSGKISRKWANECKLAESQNSIFPNEFNILGFIPTNITIKSIQEAFERSLEVSSDKIKVLNAIKKMDECFGYPSLNKESLRSLYESVKHLTELGVVGDHEFYINTLIGE